MFCIVQRQSSGRFDGPPGININKTIEFLSTDIYLTFWFAQFCSFFPWTLTLPAADHSSPSTSIFGCCLHLLPRWSLLLPLLSPHGIFSMHILSIWIGFVFLLIHSIMTLAWQCVRFVFSNVCPSQVCFLLRIFVAHVCYTDVKSLLMEPTLFSYDQFRYIANLILKIYVYSQLYLPS